MAVWFPAKHVKKSREPGALRDFFVCDLDFYRRLYPRL